VQTLWGRRKNGKPRAPRERAEENPAELSSAAMWGVAKFGKTITDCIQLAAPARIGQTHPWPESIPRRPACFNPKGNTDELEKISEKRKPAEAGFRNCFIGVSHPQYCRIHHLMQERSCSVLVLPEYARSFSRNPPRKLFLSTPVEFKLMRAHRQPFGPIRRACSTRHAEDAGARACCAPILPTDFSHGPSDSGVRPFLCSRMFEGNPMT
jgi:hypothetical protein